MFVLFPKDELATHKGTGMKHIKFLSPKIQRVIMQLTEKLVQDCAQTDQHVNP